MLWQGATPLLATGLGSRVRPTTRTRTSPSPRWNARGSSTRRAGSTPLSPSWVSKRVVKPANWWDDLASATSCFFFAMLPKLFVLWRYNWWVEHDQEGMLAKHSPSVSSMESNFGKNASSLRATTSLCYSQGWEWLDQTAVKTVRASDRTARFETP